MLGDLPRAEARNVVCHLLAECPTCREITGPLWQRFEAEMTTGRSDSEPEVRQPSPYDPILDRAFARARREAVDLARERDGAQKLIAELLKHPQARQLTLVGNSRKFQTWAFCELVIERSFETRYSDPHEGSELAEVAVAVAEKLDSETYGDRQVQDIRSRAWAHLGNARRVASDLRAAQQAFGEAKKGLDDGTGDPLDRALLSRFRAHLMRDQRRFDEANQLYETAIAIYRECGEMALTAQCLSDQGLARLYEGEPEKAIPWFEEAMELVDEKREPRLVAGISNNLAVCLKGVGRCQESLHFLERVRPVYRELGDRISLFRVRWLEGQILFDLKQLERAEEAFLEVRDAFVQEEIAYDAALVSLDLAAVYASQGRITETRRLAEQMIPIFESRDVHREALAALVVFQQAAQAESLTLALIQEISAFLQEARNQPDLRFRPSP